MAADDCKMAAGNCKMAADDCKMAAGDCKMAATVGDCKMAAGDCKTVAGDCKTAADDCKMAPGDCKTAATVGDCKMAAGDCKMAPGDFKMPASGTEYKNILIRLLILCIIMICYNVPISNDVSFVVSTECCRDDSHTLHMTDILLLVMYPCLTTMPHCVFSDNDMLTSFSNPNYTLNNAADALNSNLPPGGQTQYYDDNEETSLYEEIDAQTTEAPTNGGRKSRKQYAHIDLSSMGIAPAAQSARDSDTRNCSPGDSPDSALQSPIPVAKETRPPAPAGFLDYYASLELSAASHHDGQSDGEEEEEEESSTAQPIASKTEATNQQAKLVWFNIY